ncbi:MAG: PPC domain-containing DNA-binding protein [Thermomicrobiales bacterium]
MHIQSVQRSHYVLVRVDPGEDLLDSLRNAVHEQNIRSAAFLSGVGSIASYRVHVVKTTKLPPGNIFFEGSGAFDILSVTGLVLDGEIHAHITFSNPDRAMGGHLEQGCRVLTFAIVMLAEMPDNDFSGWDNVGPL